MAFATAGLSQVAYGNGQKLWIYNTTDTLASTVAANYFTTTDVPLMAQGDVILTTCGAAGSKTLGCVVVSVITSTTSTLTKAA
jgi:hypothetical protein